MPPRWEGGDPSCIWHARWCTLVQHLGNYYVLPGGSIGRHYVDALADKFNHLAVGNPPSSRVLVFSSVILQRDKMVRKGADICRLLDRRLQLWQQGQFNLVQEASHCDQSLRRTPDEGSTICVFTKLMLQGKLQAAVRWATKRSKGINCVVT